MGGRTVDLNSDIGEGFGPWRMGDDAALLDIITTANVACGLHAGDPLIMRRTVAMAGERGVAVGAHPGPMDLWGFGRRSVASERPEDLAGIVLYQVGALRAIADVEGVRVGHVKLHGSLSNAASVDAELAGAIASALARLDPQLRCLAPSGSAMATAAAEHGLRVVNEVFADRAYLRSGELMPRSRAGAVINDPGEVAERAARMVDAGAIRAEDGTMLALPVDSICVHGDTPGAVAAARAVRTALESAGHTVAAF